VLRDAGADDFDAIRALNHAEEQHTSAMDRYGFEQQGTQWVAGGTKQVSLQAARVTPAAD
jgi:molybdopterin/thiamine biosynthesis adenylyltransferase